MNDLKQLASRKDNDTAARVNAVAMFVHIHKTAGTTFNSILSYQYGHRRSLWVPWEDIDPACLTRLSTDELARLTLVRGHFPYGWHELIDRPVQYVTMLRHPVDRIISLYYYLRKGPDCPEHRIAAACGSLEEFVVSGQTTMVNNDQVRRIAGCGADFKNVTSETLQTALDHLTHEFACVGITERFDESILLMAESLGWRKPLFYLTSNVTQRRPRMGDVSSSVRAIIEEYNQHDLALYEQAVQLFERQLAERGQQIATAKRRLDRRNRLASRVLPWPLWMMRGLRSLFSPLARA